MPAAVDSSTKRGASAAVSPALVSARLTARTTASATSAPPTAPSTIHNAVRRLRSSRPPFGLGSRCLPPPESSPVSVAGPTLCIRPCLASDGRTRPGSCARSGTVARAGRLSGASNGRNRTRSRPRRTDCAVRPNVPCWPAAQARRTPARPLHRMVVPTYPRSPQGHLVRRTGEVGASPRRSVQKEGVHVLRRRLWVFLALSVVLFAACGDDDGGGATGGATGGGEAVTVGVSWNNYNEERWAKWDEPAIQEALQACGAEYISSDGGSSAEQQLADVENLI